MKKVTLLASLLLCGSTVFAQSVDFWYNGRALNEGEIIVASEMEYDMIKAPVHGKNQGTESVSAVLTATILEARGEGGVGYCGWGKSACTIMKLNEPLSSTRIVAGGEEVDPEIEAMSFEDNSFAKVKYEMKYGSTTKTVFVEFVHPSASISTTVMGKNVTVFSKGGVAEVKYSFDTDVNRTLNIYNVTGKLVASKVVSGLDGNLSFSLNKGIYLYSIVEKGKIVNTSKFSIK